MAAEQVAQRADALGVEAVARFVEDEYGRLAEKGSGEAEPLAHAERVGAGVASVGRSEVQHDLHGRRLAGPVRSEEAGDPSRRHPEGEVIDNGPLAVALRDVIDVEPVAVVAPCAGAAVGIAVGMRSSRVMPVSSRSRSSIDPKGSCQRPRYDATPMDIRPCGHRVRPQRLEVECISTSSTRLSGSFRRRSMCPSFVR